MASRHLLTPTSSRKIADPFTVRATGVRPSTDVSTPAAATSRVRKALYMPAIGPDTTPAPEPAPESEGAPEPESVGIGANLGDSREPSLRLPPLRAATGRRAAAFVGLNQAEALSTGPLFDALSRRRGNVCLHRPTKTPNIESIPLTKKGRGKIIKCY